MFRNMKCTLNKHMVHSYVLQHIFKSFVFHLRSICECPSVSSSTVHTNNMGERGPSFPGDFEESTPAPP